MLINHFYGFFIPLSTSRLFPSPQFLNGPIGGGANGGSHHHPRLPPPGAPAAATPKPPPLLPSPSSVASSVSSSFSLAAGVAASAPQAAAAAGEKNLGGSDEGGRLSRNSSVYAGKGRGGGGREGGGGAFQEVGGWKYASGRRRFSTLPFPPLKCFPGRETFFFFLSFSGLETVSGPLNPPYWTVGRRNFICSTLIFLSSPSFPPSTDGGVGTGSLASVGSSLASSRRNSGSGSGSGSGAGGSASVVLHVGDGGGHEVKSLATLNDLTRFFPSLFFDFIFFRSP